MVGHGEGRVHTQVHICVRMVVWPRRCLFTLRVGVSGKVPRGGDRGRTPNDER